MTQPLYLHYEVSPGNFATIEWSEHFENALEALSVWYLISTLTPWQNPTGA